MNNSDRKDTRQQLQRIICIIIEALTRTSQVIQLKDYLVAYDMFGNHLAPGNNFCSEIGFFFVFSLAPN